VSEELDTLEIDFDRTLTALLPIDTLLIAAASDAPVSPELLGRLRGLGWHLAAVPEPGGLGLTADGIARLAMLAGRHLLPAHLAGESFLLAPALDAEPAASRLDALAGGALAGGAGFATGDGVFAWLAPGATVAAIDSGDEVLLVDLKKAATVPVTGLDAGQGLARIDLAAGAIDSLPAADSERILRIHRLALIAQTVGIVDAVLSRSVEYASTRKQFGQPIASFQAVAHRLAGMKVALDSGRSALARLVALIEVGDLGAADDRLAAFSYALPEAARHAVEDAIQVHGGMGFTWEYGLHLWYRRALALQWALGGRREAASRAGRRYIDRRRLQPAAHLG
jgi:alkylation response protein AidB-like acyl-CoA dehydrogenase